MEKKILFRILGEFSLFKGIEEEKIEKILSNTSLLAFEKGVYIFEENKKAEGMYILLSGLVKICHNTQDGREIVLHLIRTGNTFGEAAAFQGALFPASAYTVQASRVLFFPIGVLRESVLKYPEWGLNLLTVFALRLRMFTRKIEARGGKDIIQRLAAYLLHRSRLEDNNSVLKLGISQEVLGNMLGTSRESISRAFAKLVDYKSIDLKGKEIHLLDSKLLHSIAEGSFEYTLS